MNKGFMISKVMAISYLTHQVSGRIDDALHELLKESLDSVRNRTSVLGEDDDILSGLLRLSESVISPVGLPYGRDKIISEIISITEEEDNLYISGFEDIVPSDKVSTSEKKAIISREVFSLRSVFAERELRNVLERATATLRSKSLTGGLLREFAESVQENIDALPLGGAGGDPALIERFSTHDTEEHVIELMQGSIDQQLSGKVWRTGLKSLNESLNGGPRVGDFMIVAALEGSYKTGFCDALFLHLCLYNSPRKFIRDPELKPALVSFRFEDNMDNSIYFLWLHRMYSKNYANGQDLKVPDARKINAKQMYDEIMPYLSREKVIAGAEEEIPEGREDYTDNWEVFIERYNPDNWGYIDVINRCNEIQAEGHEIHAIHYDYLLMLNPKGCGTGGTHGSDYRNLLRKNRGYVTSISAFGLSPTQLSPAAKKMVADGGKGIDFLPAIRGAGMFSSSSKLGEELDILLYINVINKGPGRSYLHCLLDKHRSPCSVKSLSKKEFFLRFPTPDTPVPDDVLLPDDRRIGSPRPPMSSMSDDDFFT